MKKILNSTAFALAIFLFAGNANSQHKVESWYVYFGLGYANPQYPDGLDQSLNTLADQPNVSHATGALDLIGFYWPVGGDRTVIGGVINAFGDRYKNDDTNVKLQITGITMGFSAMHFLTHEIGRGLFLRADAGPSRFEIDVEGGGVTVSGSSEWGFGALVGAGYGIPVSGSTRILLNLNYAFRKIEGDTVGALAITVGGLF